jgi:hypothetical protein
MLAQLDCTERRTPNTRRDQGEDRAPHEPGKVRDHRWSGNCDHNVQLHPSVGSAKRLGLAPQRKFLCLFIVAVYQVRVVEGNWLPDSTPNHGLNQIQKLVVGPDAAKQHQHIFRGWLFLGGAGWERAQQTDKNRKERNSA